MHLSLSTALVDPSIAVALTAIGTAFITTIGGVAVAVLANRREAENAAEAATEGALRERLVLRDEQIEALEWKVRNREAKIAEVETRAAVLQAELNQANAKIAHLESRGPHA